MVAEFVKPFRQSHSINSNRNDADAICMAVRQPNMSRVLAKR